MSVLVYIYLLMSYCGYSGINTTLQFKELLVTAGVPVRYAAEYLVSVLLIQANFWGFSSEIFAYVFCSCKRVYQLLHFKKNIYYLVNMQICNLEITCCLQVKSWRKIYDMPPGAVKCPWVQIGGAIDWYQKSLRAICRFIEILLFMYFENVLL